LGIVHTLRIPVKPASVTMQFQYQANYF
jgi:hypothetical protein